MEIAFAKAEDSQGILNLYREFNEDRIKAGVGDAQYKYLDGEMPWAKTLSEDDTFTLVAKEKGVIIGFITLWLPEFNPFKKDRKLGEVDLIVVEQKLRKRGLGRLLYRAAEGQLRKFHVSHILLNVKLGNVPAMIFWTKMGFKKVSDTKYKRADGGEEKTFYMVKKM